ncbi:DUF6878 family protein [Alexandriicola marinus]|nr:DUF6878 family protein [Alexandriicola marinus]
MTSPCAVQRLRAYGTLTWDIAADSITLDHADRYVECSHSYDEGL